MGVSRAARAATSCPYRLSCSLNDDGDDDDGDRDDDDDDDGGDDGDDDDDCDDDDDGDLPPPPPPCLLSLTHCAMSLARSSSLFSSSYCVVCVFVCV